jgi:hypothetical protein
MAPPPADFVLVTAEIVSWLSAGCALLFILNVVLAFKEANTASMWGRPGVLTEAAEKAAPAVYALAVCLSAAGLGGYVNGLIDQGARTGNDVLVLWSGLLVFALQGVLITVSLEMAIGIVVGTVESQVAHLLGRPHAVWHGWRRAASVMLAGGLALVTPHIAVAIVRSLMG